MLDGSFVANNPMPTKSVEEAPEIIEHPVTGEKIELKPDVVITDTDKKFTQETNSLFDSFFTDYGIIAAKPGQKPENIMNLIFELIKELKQALQDLKQQYSDNASDIAIKMFDTAIKGVKKMLDFAEQAKNQAFISAGVSMGAAAGQGAATAVVRHRHGNNKEGGLQKMQTEANIMQAAGQTAGSTSKFFDANAGLAQAEGQAATKEAEALASFLQTMNQVMQELMKEVDSIFSALNQTQAGTTSAEKPRILA